MPGSNVRVTEHSHNVLRELARTHAVPMQEILERAIEAYQRQKFLEDVNAAYAALRSQPEGWQQEREEREAWDNTLQDGLEPE